MKETFKPLQVYNMKEVAKVIGVSGRTMRRYAATGRLAAAKIGKMYFATGENVLKFLAGDNNEIVFELIGRPGVNGITARNGDIYDSHRIGNKIREIYLQDLNSSSQRDIKISITYEKH